MFPSMGAKHIKGDHWIRFDPSFKNYKYTEGLDISSDVAFNGSDFIDSIKNTGAYNATDSYIYNLDNSAINSTLENHQSQTLAFINQTNSNASMNDIYGGKDIIKHQFTILLGTLPYKTDKVHARYRELPDSLRHKVRITVSSDDNLSLSDPVSVTVSLPESVGKKLYLSYVAASTDDETVRESYGAETSFPAYLVNVKAELKLDNTVLFTGSPVSMGTAQELKVELINTSSINHALYAIKAGYYTVIGINTGTLGLDINEKINSVNVSSTDDAMSEMLYQSILGYWMENDAISSSYNSAFDINAVRVPSEGIVSTPLDLEYLFGVPVSGSYTAMAFDIKEDLWLIKALDGDADKKIKYNIVTGMISSVLEGAVFDQLFTEDTDMGVSAIALLAVALQSGIKVYGIDKSNIDAIIPKLQVDSSVINAVKSAVNAGSVVIMPEKTMTYAGWNGDSYIVLDSQGNGAYMISGGTAGGRMLMRMPGAYPMLQKPLLVDLQQSLDKWLISNGSSYK